MPALRVVLARLLLFPKPNSKVIFPSLKASTYSTEHKWWDVPMKILYSSAKQGILPQFLRLLMLKALPWGQGAAAYHNHRTSGTSETTGPWEGESRTPIFTCILPKYTDCRAWACSECNFSWAWIDLSASARLFWIWAACLDTKHPVGQYLPSEPPQFLNQLFQAQTPDLATKPRCT